MAASYRPTEDRADWNLDAWFASREPQSRKAKRRITRKRKLAKAVREIRGEKRA